MLNDGHRHTCCRYATSMHGMNLVEQAHEKDETQQRWKMILHTMKKVRRLETDIRHNCESR